MKFKPVKLAPALIATGVIVFVCLVRVLNFGLFDRLEKITYDWRVRVSQRFPQPAATNLGAVFISDDSITALNNGSLGYRYGFNWPRHLYGRMLRECSTQGARVVALDIVFGELNPKDAQVKEAGDRRRGATDFLKAVYPEEEPLSFTDQGEEWAALRSDDYFAWQLNRSGIAVLAAKDQVRPHPLFATNAVAFGDISAEPDADGALRRAKAFILYTNWHWAFRQVEATKEYGVDLSKARIEPTQIILPRSNASDFIKLQLDGDGNFALEDLGAPPPGVAPKAKPFTIERVWHMGIVLASQALKLDLTNPQVDLLRGQIVLRGDRGLTRVLPVDGEGYFDINWELTVHDKRLTKAPVEELLKQDIMRSEGHTNDLVSILKDKLLVVGSTATGNNLTDLGATPLGKATFLLSKHWNVANSIITGRFVRRASLPIELLLVTILGVATAILTWQWRVSWAAGGVILLALVYCAASLFLYVQYRYWVPLVLPVIGAMLVEHGALVTYRVIFEQRERKRVLSVFDKMVSRHVAKEVLGMETLSLVGSRREITVYFADVRGFTELTDGTNERAAKMVAERHLTGAAADAVFDELAREMINTVNSYLALVADVVNQHDGTLDKFIGDCVMSYWGAPTPNPHHARLCVRAAIDAQRAIHQLNLERGEENKRRETENLGRAREGVPLQPMLPVLSLGSGINSGVAIAGLMGSEKHERSYTVFGREVNLASRLEGVSGRGRIIIGEATYQQLLRDDPDLAAICIEQEPTKPKGFQKPIRNYEVPWQKTLASNETISKPT